ncbi:MAG TPA: DMT family transporter [Anaerolineales bacterium]|nr:DMT family transporter [Anaerolineales bacterium]
MIKLSNEWQSAKKRGQLTGIGAASASAMLLGLAPIFGKQAINMGFSALAVVALRTSIAASLLFVIVALFRRPYLFIYPAGLLGCGLAGALNGVGSILYYLALERLTVSVGQLLYSLYPIFLILWLIIDRQSPSRLTYLRMGIAFLGIIFLTFTNAARIDWGGVCLMLGASIMYAIHLPINQRVLYDIPAPTVTLYTLIAMSAIVVPVYLIFDRHLPATGTSWTPILALAMVTFFSRLLLFMGIKNLGGMQTALLGLGELIVSISISHFWLHESLFSTQWVGAGLLGLSLVLIGFERIQPEKRHIHGILGWLRPPEISTEISVGPHE